MDTEAKLKLAIDTLKEVLRVVRQPASGHMLIEREETLAAAEIVLSGLEYMK